jgi:hypothetical protein
VNLCLGGRDEVVGFRAVVLRCLAGFFGIGTFRDRWSEDGLGIFADPGRESEPAREAQAVSRAHARLERRGEEVFVLDLGSTNFTRVNGERVGERALRHGDELRFGRARCLYLVEDGADPAAGSGG